MKRFATNILIRNNRLPAMQSQGISVKYEILSEETYIKELKAKLVEEAIELLSAKNKEELIEEIADVIEVIEHIIEANKLNPDEIDDIKKQKNKKLGGFDKKIKTHYVEMKKDNPNIGYYLERPNKYPEI